MTNREWLESLSDEELARTFTKLNNRTSAMCELCKYKNIDCETYERALSCTEGITKWLRAEHEED